jgi:hypothetical protein
LCTTTTTERPGRWRRESHIQRTNAQFKDGRLVTQQNCAR